MLIAVNVAFPQDTSSNVMILMRWIHFIAGIAWVGMLYFFNLVTAKYLPTLDAATRSRIYPGLMSRALFWFRWSAVVTVLVGIAYWMHIATQDAHNAHASPGRVFWTFFVFWTVAFFVEMAILMAPARGLHRLEIVLPVAFAVCAIAAWLYVSTNNQGWESNRVLCIGIGGGLGWFMMFNVWGLIWRVQKKLIAFHTDTPGGAMPEKLAEMAKVAGIASRVNFVLSFPMLFFMAAASHYPFLG